MAVTPAGDPAWARTSDYSTYGGHSDKANYQSQGAVNPRTDVTAEQFSRMVEDLANAVRTADFAKMRVETHDTSPAAPTIHWCRLMTAVRNVSYEGDSAPTGFPSGARVGTGTVTITFASSYDDAYGVAQAFTPSHAAAMPIDQGCAYVTTSISGNVVTVYCYDETGTLLDDSFFILEVS